MSAFSCVSCGEPVIAKNAMAQRLMEMGGKMPMCDDCRRGRAVEKSWTSYEAYLQSPEWKALARQRRKIDGYRCRLCNRSDRLQVHHRTYDRQYHEDIEDLTTLCDECHDWYSAWKKAQEKGRQLVGFAPVSFSLD